MEYIFALDGSGAPVLLAPVAEAKPKAQADPETEVAKGSDARRRDAVVDAARTLEDLSPAGVEQFVRRRWRGDRALSTEDFKSFSDDARVQRKHDVVDALDHRIRRAVNGRASARQAHVSLPRGLGAKALASLEGDELTEVVSRLRDRGWDEQQIYRHGVRRLDREGKMRGLFGANE